MRQKDTASSRFCAGRWFDVSCASVTSVLIPWFAQDGGSKSRWSSNRSNRYDGEDEDSSEEYDDSDEDAYTSGG